MRKGIQVGAAILAWVVLCGPALSAPPPFSEISAALDAGDGAQALALANAALAETDLSGADRARLLLDHGLAQRLQGDADGALANLTRAIDAHSLTDPEQARAYLERGLILDGMGRLDDAIGDYSAVLRLTPSSATALNNRANAFRRQNRFEDARRGYLASLAADNPAPEYPYYGLGQIAESQGMTEEAKDFYARAVAANPGYALAADRLAALGGGAIPAPAITLHPPKSMTAGNTAIVLQPPAAKAVMEPVPTIKPVGYSDRDGQSGLRPAMDNPGGGQVQLGAWRQEAEAAEAWNKAVRDAGGILSGFAPHIVAVNLPGKGRYYRLRVETPDGRQLCASLAAKGMDCIPARN
jgi:tetratricopeptide (TPR) repeat protein